MYMELYRIYLSEGRYCSVRNYLPFSFVFFLQEMQCLLTGFETSVIAMLTIFRSLPLSQGKLKM